MDDNFFFYAKGCIDRQFLTSSSFNRTCSCLADGIINACKNYERYKGRADLTRCNTCVKARLCRLRLQVHAARLRWVTVYVAASRGYYGYPLSACCVHTFLNHGRFSLKTAHANRNHRTAAFRNRARSSDDDGFDAAAPMHIT